MQIYWHLALVLIASSVVFALFGRTPATGDLLTKHGYPVEKHLVNTEDGNIVQVFRIPYSHKLQNKGMKRPIVLLQHGLLSCSDMWVVSGPNDSLAFLLADAGFDVWLGNSRGNVYSKQIKVPSWNFSWHEIGYYDTAAVIDYALKENEQGQKSLHYVGHSQGTTGFFVLMSLRPEYNLKIKTSHMFAPVAIMKSLNNPCTETLLLFCRPGSLLNYMFSNRASFPLFTTTITNTLRMSKCPFWSGIFKTRNANKTALEYGSRHYPAGGSNNQILHFFSNIISGEFRQYDYGPRKNMEIYNSKQPPEYPLENIFSEVHLWYSDADLLAPGVDVLPLSKRLPKMFLHQMADPTWSHFDFGVHMEVRKYLNEPVIQIMKNSA